MLISVIIPNYNHSKFLEQRIRSVLNQSYDFVELIILDDSSTDESISIIENFRNNKKISKILINEKNSGSTFKQWQKGIQQAKGEWIWIAESDDIADERFLEELVSKISGNENIVVAYSDSWIINDNNEIIGEITWTKDMNLKRDGNLNYINNGKEEVENYFFYKNIIPNASAAIFRKDIIDTHWFIEISTMKFAGDWLFWILILSKGDVLYISKKLNYFRNHNNTTRSNKSLNQELIRFNEIWFVISNIKIRYNLDWNYKKHLWLLNSWVLNCFKFNAWKVYHSDFPIMYKLICILKYLKIKFIK